MIQELNKNLLVYLNSLTQNNFFECFVFIFADFPIFFLPVFLVVTWIYYAIKKQTEKKSDLLLIFYGVVLAIITNLIIQQFVDISRPETALEGTGKLILSHIPDASFPSDHSAVGFAFAFGLLFAGYKKIYSIFLPITIAMVIARVMAGVHWPLDVIAGAIIGGGSSYVIFKYFKKQKLVKTLNDFIIKMISIIKL